jgi:hypothetical protein
LGEEFKQPRGVPIALRPMIVPGTEEVGEGDAVRVVLPVLLAIGPPMLLDGLKVVHELMDIEPIYTSAQPAGIRPLNTACTVSCDRQNFA